MQVVEGGKVSIVHEMHEDTFKEWKKGDISVDNKVEFRIDWDGGNFPTTADNCGNECEVVASSDTCLCNTTVTSSMPFSSLSEPPSLDEVISTLRVTVLQSVATDASIYSLHSTTSDGVKIYLPVGTTTLTEDAVFQVQTFSQVHRYYKNSLSTVHIGSSFSFRNPPSFMSVIEPTARDAFWETEAVLDVFFNHPNLAPFLADFLIKRLVTSNPTPRYVEVVANAFISGKFGNEFGSGEYGDLEATIAAVLLDRESLSSTLEADTTQGKMREPILKLMHIMRSLEVQKRNGGDIADNFIYKKIGQMATNTPSVFNFYQSDYQPAGKISLSSLVSPEGQLINAPTVLSWLNGILSLVEYGLTSCYFGFFTPSRSDQICWKERLEKEGHKNSNKWNSGHLSWEPEDLNDVDSVLDELDLLLTGGRLQEASKRIISAEFVKQNADTTADDSVGKALRTAINLMSATPEFQIEGTLHSTTTTKRATSLPEEAAPDDPSDYKAIVYIFMTGGVDSFNILMPHSECNGGIDLETQYQDVRTDIALAKSTMLEIDATSQSQPCNKFGLHPELTFVQSLYNDSDVSFIANIGSMVEPITKEEYNSKSKEGEKREKRGRTNCLRSFFLLCIFSSLVTGRSAAVAIRA